jgi:hypothetical protein
MKIKVFNLLNLAIVLTFVTFIWIIAELISPYLHYHNQQTAFLNSFDFLRFYLSYPGGVGDYIGEFLAQFFVFNLFGSFVIAVIGACQGLFILRVLKVLFPTFRLSYFVFTLTLLLGVFVMGDFNYPYYISTRLMILLLFVWLFALVVTGRHRYVGVFWMLSVPLVFYMAGGASLFVYGATSLIIFLQKSPMKYKIVWVILFLVYILSMPFLAYWFLFPISLYNMIAVVMNKPPAMLQYFPDAWVYVYYTLLPILILGVYLFNYCAKKLGKISKFGLITAKQSSVLSLFLQILAGGLVSFLFLYKAVTRDEKSLLMIEFYAENAHWQKVIETSKQIRKYNIKINFQVNRAMWHLGILNDWMLQYPQLQGSKGLIIENEVAENYIMPASDLYFDLGAISESQRWAYEMQTMLPYSPRCLKRLVMICIINQDYINARKFLDVLGENWIYKNWCGKYSRFVKDTALTATDPLIAIKRSFNPQMRSVFLGPEIGLNVLMTANSKNRMAYDYLMNYYLLEGQLAKFERAFVFYKTFSPSRIPKIWEEALVYISFAGNNNQVPEPNEFISSGCKNSFMQFNDILRKKEGDPVTTRVFLTKKFADSYWYYMLYVNPNVTSKSNR